MVTDFNIFRRDPYARSAEEEYFITEYLSRHFSRCTEYADD